MDEYIYFLKYNWILLKKKPKLEISEIEKIKDEICRMYLYCFYCYFDKLYSYNINMLSQIICINNVNNLYLLSAFFRLY
jgi:hypothetical protein